MLENGPSTELVFGWTSSRPTITLLQNQNQSQQQIPLQQPVFPPPRSRRGYLRSGGSVMSLLAKNQIPNVCKAKRRFQVLLIVILKPIHKAPMNPQRSPVEEALRGVMAKGKQGQEQISAAIGGSSARKRKDARRKTLKSASHY